MYALSGFAFLIYVAKIPERWCIGWFDCIGHSHNLWHLIVLAALCYWHNSGKCFPFFLVRLPFFRAFCQDVCVCVCVFP